MYHLFGNLAVIGKPDIFIYGVFLIISIYAYTELMDGNKNAVWWEILKAIIGIIILKSFNGWFGLTGKSAVLILFYLIFSVIVTYLISNFKKNQSPLNSVEVT
jgi:hypothetical protein